MAYFMEMFYGDIKKETLSHFLNDHREYMKSSHRVNIIKMAVYNLDNRLYVITEKNIVFEGLGYLPDHTFP